MALQKSSHIKKSYEIALTCIAWFAVIFQLYLTTDTIFNFSSYFTILSNIVIAISLTFALIAPSSTFGKYFSLITVQSAIALYIFVVGLVYNTILRGIWTPQGWQLVIDDLLHVAVPVLYVLYWLIFIEKGTLKWKDGVAWIYLPLVYLIYSLIRGHFTGWYPYPFLDAVKFGYQKVFVNIGLMIIAFFVVGLLLIWVDHLMKKKKVS
jgi:hypothetical protein